MLKKSVIGLQNTKTLWSSIMLTKVSGAWNNKERESTMKKTRIRVTYLAGRPQDVGKYYYGETWTDENGEHFRVKFGKQIRTDRPWTFEQVKGKA